MMTLVIWGAAFAGLMIVLSLIPGLKEAVSPLWKLLFTLIHFFAEQAGQWFVFLAKTLIGAHRTYLTNLFNRAETLDPTLAIRSKLEEDGR